MISRLILIGERVSFFLATVAVVLNEYFRNKKIKRSEASYNPDGGMLDDLMRRNPGNQASTDPGPGEVDKDTTIP